MLKALTRKGTAAAVTAPGDLADGAEAPRDLDTDMITLEGSAAGVGGEQMIDWESYSSCFEGEVGGWPSEPLSLLLQPFLLCDVHKRMVDCSATTDVCYN